MNTNSLALNRPSFRVAGLSFLFSGFVLFSCTQVSTQPLLKSSEFTPPKKFPSGVEGSAVSSTGILYAVNFAKPGTIGQLSSREFIVDTLTKKVKPFVWEAQKRGVVFDVGYGGISFAYTQAIPAIKQGFYPNTILVPISIPGAITPL